MDNWKPGVLTFLFFCSFFHLQELTTQTPTILLWGEKNNFLDNNTSVAIDLLPLVDTDINKQYL